MPLDAPAATYGPLIQHRLLARLQDTAANNGLKLNLEQAERLTHTDTDNVQIAREGIPSLLIDLPLKYMHTTVELVERAIRNSSRPGDVVLDPFGGSGTTLIAAEKSGRVGRLMELDPKYCDVIVRRWEDFTGEVALRVAAQDAAAA